MINGKQVKRMVCGCILVGGLLGSMGIQSSVMAQDTVGILLTDVGNTAQTATELEWNSVHTTELTSKSDVDYYKFVIQEDGYFQIDFGNSQLTEEDICGNYYGWDIRLFDINNNTIYSQDNVKTTCAIPTYSFKAGTYYIRVNTNGNFRCPVDVPYHLQVKFTKDEYYEEEDNGEVTSSREIQCNQAYTGSVYSRADEDYYKFTISEEGYFCAYLGNEKLTDNDIAGAYYGWDLTIYDSSAKVLYKKENIKQTHTTENLSFQPGTYYLNVKTAYNGSETKPINVPYQVKVSFTASEYWEQENNDTMATSRGSAIGTKYSGTLSNKNDVDYYKVKIQKSGYYQVILGNDTFTSNDVAGDYYGWDVAFQNKQAQELCKLENIKKKDSTVPVYIKKGTYYVKVYTGVATGNVWNPRRPFMLPYQVVVKAVPTMEKPTNVKAVLQKKCKVKLSWKKVSGASSYKIYRSTKAKSGYQEVAIVKKVTSYKDKRVVKGKTYYYKIVAAKTFKGQQIWGSISNKCKIKVKK